MAEPNLPTSEYIRMKRDTEWLLDADHGRSSVAPYDQHARSPVHLGPGVHKQPWRFNPTKSKTFDQIQSSKGVERAMAERLLLTEIQQRHQDALDGKPTRQPRRRRKPRTLQPMPMRQHHQARIRQASVFPAQQHSPQLADAQYTAYNSMYHQEMALSPSSGRALRHAHQNLNTGVTYPGAAGSGGGGGGGVGSPVYGDPQSFFRAKDQNEVVVSAMAKQLKKYKLECRRLRKQKRATLYVLRLLEQKILELSGSNATAEKIDPTAPGYEMHPEVYKILKDGHTATKGCRGVQTGSDDVDVVEDYALERSAHELGLKLVREDRAQALNSEEQVENEERAMRVAEEEDKEKKKKMARENAKEEECLRQEADAALAQAEAEAKNANSKASTGGAEGAAGDGAAFEGSGAVSAGDVAAQSNAVMTLSLADNARNELLEKRRKKFRAIFERLDTDISGYLDKQELRKAVYTDKELGSYVRPRTFATAFAVMDYNDNGQIPYPAFEAFCMDCEDSQNPAKLNSTAATSPAGQGHGRPPTLGQSRAQWTNERLQEIFNRLDSNQNGSLERIEILRASHSDPDLSVFITPKRVNASFAEMSRKGDDGKLVPILFEDFKVFCRRASARNLVSIEPSSVEMDKFRKIFERLDSNGNGTLERMELYKASHMDPEMSTFVAPRQFNEAFKRMDVHSSGHITFEAFAGFCMDVENSMV
jgi:Ca2+-binding EF-hand superfamily protein